MKTFSDFLSEQDVWSVGWNGAKISVLGDPVGLLGNPTHTEIVDRLIADLQKITAESFGVELDTKTNDGVKNHVINASSIAFLHDHGQVIGFASAKLFPKEGVFYLHGVATAQNSKCRGVGKKLIHTLVAMAGLRRIAFTTQNPIMYCLLRSLCTKVFPQLEYKRVPLRMRNLGQKLVAERPGKISPESSVITDLYGRCLYDEIPDSHDKEVNWWFKTALNIEDGRTRNGFLFIGENGS